jgi:hypothetical protein
VASCGLQNAVNGSAAVAQEKGGCLNTVGPTGFLPTASLAAKLGVPAGGVSVAATRQAFESARDAGSQGTYFGPGLWHTALEGLEGAGAATILASKDWRLTDPEVRACGGSVSP